MKQPSIDRINELARKSRSVGLTEQEKQEQSALRQEYVASFRRSLTQQLDNVVLVAPDGSKTQLKPKQR